LTPQIYVISYQHDGAEVPGEDFDDKCQLFYKVAREWVGWRESLTVLCQTIRNKSDFGGIKFQTSVFLSAVKDMKKVKEKRTPKLVGVARRLFPRIEEFQKFLKIETWNEDRKLALRDVASSALASAQKV
jgi:hypothetical protein